MTSPVQANLIKRAAQSGNIELAVKLCVMANLQMDKKGLFVYEAEQDAVSAGLTKHQFAGGLAALTKKGIYTPSDDPEYRGKFGYFTDAE